jgi:hypothetical protein
MFDRRGRSGLALCLFLHLDLRITMRRFLFPDPSASFAAGRIGLLCVCRLALVL